MPSNTAPPASYASLDFKNLAITNVPADHPTPAGVVVVALNRPDKLNTMTGDMLHELERAYRLFNVDDRVRAIVLTGQGESFCAGVDLSGELGRLQDQKGSNEDKFRDLGGQVALAISRCAKPTVAAINGAAVGVGLTLSMSASIRVAWEGARVGLPFSRRGLTLESCSAFYLPRLVGLGNAMHMATTGAVYWATDPVVRGLFSRVLPTPAETLAHAVELAGDIAHNTSLTSGSLMRDMLVYCPPSPEGAHVLDSRIFISLLGTPDNVEGIKSFMEKRRPQFGGTVDHEALPFWPWWNTSTAGQGAGDLKAKI